MGSGISSSSADDQLIEAVAKCLKDEPERFTEIYEKANAAAKRLENAEEPTKTTERRPIETPTPPPSQSKNDTLLCIEVLKEMNAVRRDPGRYADKVEALLSQFEASDPMLFREDPNDTSAPLLRTQEGAAAVSECVEALRSHAPVPALDEALDPRLNAAATDHALDIGRSGSTAHEGADDSTPQQRIERHGEWSGALGENLSFGCASAERVVLQLLVDDGVPSRGHRANILNANFVRPNKSSCCAILPC